MNTRSILFTIVIVSLATLVFLSMATAQSNSSTNKTYATKGVVELGGSVGFQSYTPVSGGQSSNTTYTNFSLTPSVGYFVSDGLEVGLDPFSLTTSSQTGATSSQTEIHILGAIAYAIKTEGAAYPFIEGVAGYTTYSSGSYSANGFSWGVRGGVKVAVVSHVLVMGGLQYLQITETPSGASSRSGYNELMIGVGLSVWL